MDYRYTPLIKLLNFVIFHCVYWPTFSDVLPSYLPSAVERLTPFDIGTCCFVHMPHLLLDAGLCGVGLSEHPAVTIRIIFFYFDAVREFLMAVMDGRLVGGWIGGWFGGWQG